MLGKPRQQESEASAHITSTIRETERDQGRLLLSSLSLRMQFRKPHPGIVLSIVRVGLLTPINVVKITPLGSCSDCLLL